MEENKGTYAAVKPDDESKHILMKYLHDKGVPNPESGDKLHSTLLYSRKHLKDYKSDAHLSHDATPHKIEVWPTKSGKKCLVLKLHSPSLQARHEHLMDKHKATYDYPEFKPHISLSYDIGDYDHSKLTHHDIPHLKLTHEYHEDLDTTGK